MRLDWDTLNPPCCICKDSQAPSTGVLYAYPLEVKFYCRDHLPDEFDERKIKTKNRLKRVK